jgi:hypothetical protein
MFYGIGHLWLVSFSIPKHKGIVMKEETTEESRRNFLRVAQQALPYLWEICNDYEDLSHDDNGKTSKDYPFGSSYDEWLYEYGAWLTTLENEWFPQSKTFEPTITVGELKEILEKYNNDRQIVIGTDSWYRNIGSVEFPDDCQTYTLTLYPGTEFNVFQL